VTLYWSGPDRKPGGVELQSHNEHLELPAGGMDAGAGLRSSHDLFERYSRRFGPDDARRVGFTPFSLRSLRATVDASLGHCRGIVGEARQGCVFK